MKILNLNKLSKVPVRSLSLDGVNHPIMPLDCGGFISINLAVEQLAGAGPVEQLNMIVDSVCRQVPTVSRERFLEFDLETMNEIAAFVRGEDVDGQEEQAAAAAEAGK